MPRDDSMLYTGLSSASSRANAEQRKQKKGEKSRERAKLLPVAELINSLIEKEKATVSNISDLIISPEAQEESVKAELIARRKNLEFITAFQAKINILLRAPKEESSNE